MAGTNLWIPFQIQLDSTGSGEYEVGAPALGENWQAFCTLNPAPSGQSQTISVSGQVVASGARQSGPFAAGSGQGVTVAVAGGTASSAVAGVLQGAILQGTAAQAALPGNGNLFEISGGVVDVTGSSVTIQAGQNGVNVSTDAPPVAGPTIDMPSGETTYTQTITPPSNATAVGFSCLPLSGGNQLGVEVVDPLTGEILHNQQQASGSSVGFSFTLPMTPTALSAGLRVSVTVTTALGTTTPVVYTTWYLGTNSLQPVNYPTQPLYVQGQGAEGIAATDPYTGSLTLDMVIVGNGAEALNEKSEAAIPIDVVVQGINASGNTKVGISGSVDQIVQGIQGSGTSVQTVRQPPQHTLTIGYTSTAGGIETLLSGTIGKSIRIRQVHLSTTAGTPFEADLQSPSGTSFTKSAVSATLPWDQPFEGYILPAGEGLYLYTSAAATILGTITYDLY